MGILKDYVHIYQPGTPGETTPTLLLLHGTGGNENDLIPLGRQAMPGANLLSVRGRVLENGMNRYFRRFAEGVFDEEDVRARSGELAEFALAASEEYSFDPRSVFAIGYSNGANIAAAIALLEPKTLAGGVLIRAMVPLIPALSPDLAGKSFSIHSGEEDLIAPLASGRRLSELLKQAGAKVELSILRTGHSIIREDIEKLKSWFAENAY